MTSAKLSRVGVLFIPKTGSSSQPHCIATSHTLHCNALHIVLDRKEPWTKSQMLNSLSPMKTVGRGFLCFRIWHLKQAPEMAGGADAGKHGMAWQPS